MNALRLIFLCLFLSQLACRLTLHGASNSADPAGHWEGAINLPGTALAIQIDLAHQGEVWQGTIEIPAQGLHGFKLDPVKIDGAAVEFALPGVPGNPQFAGRLAEDANEIHGDFTQGPGKYPFNLARKAAPVYATESTAKGIPGHGLESHWLGSLKPAPGIELRVALEVTSAKPDKPEGFLVSLDQGNAVIPVTALSEHDGIIHLEMPSVGGSSNLKLNDDGSELSGEWQQGGPPLPIQFKRTAHGVDLDAVANRPQLPKKPYPYAEEEVVVENKAAGVKLAGTLTLPSGSGPHPVVVLITGSGAQDRDEFVAGHRPFLVLADHLTRQGIAVLRCDDRGTAKSTGDFSQAIDSDFVQDTLAAVSYLRTRKEIDAHRIGLVGHSEGGTVAARVAAQSSDVAFIVMLAGVGLPVNELKHQQINGFSRASGYNEKQTAGLVAFQYAFSQILREERDPMTVERAIHQAFLDQVASLPAEQQEPFREFEAGIKSNMKLLMSPWYRDLLDFDPQATLRAVKCPVLAINGEKDQQVPAKPNLSAIREALAAGGNTRVKIVELPNLNHLLQACQTGAPTEYARIGETFNPAALRQVSDWIHEVVSIQR